MRGDGERGKGDPRLQLVGVACDASRAERDDERGAGNKVWRERFLNKKLRRSKKKEKKI